jgi:hypothetical protein
MFDSGVELSCVVQLDKSVRVPSNGRFVDDANTAPSPSEIAASVLHCSTLPIIVTEYTVPPTVFSEGGFCHTGTTPQVNALNQESAHQPDVPAKVAKSQKRSSCSALAAQPCRSQTI